MPICISLYHAFNVTKIWQDNLKQTGSLWLFIMMPPLISTWRVDTFGIMSGAYLSSRTCTKIKCCFHSWTLGSVAESIRNDKTPFTLTGRVHICVSAFWYLGRRWTFLTFQWGILFIQYICEGSSTFLINGRGGFVNKNVFNLWWGVQYTDSTMY